MGIKPDITLYDFDNHVWNVNKAADDKMLTALRDSLVWHHALYNTMVPRLEQQERELIHGNPDAELPLGILRGQEIP